MKSATLGITCIFFINSTCLANTATLSPLFGNPEIYRAMENMMNDRLADHTRKIDKFIQDYALEYKDKVQDLPNMPKINSAFWTSVRNSKGESTVKLLESILAETGGKIQVMFVKDSSQLPVFKGKKVWGHAGTYISVFALESERDTQLGRDKIIARLFHEIWARSTRAKDIYIEEIRKSCPKTAEEVLKAAKQARVRYNREISQIYIQIMEFHHITSPKLQKQFAELRFEKQVDYINRDLTLPDKTADKFLNPDITIPLPPDSFHFDETDYYEYSRLPFISKDGQFFFCDGICYNTLYNEPQPLPLKGAVSQGFFSPKDMYLAVNYKNDSYCADIIDAETKQVINIEGLSQHVKSFGFFSHSGELLPAYLPDGTAQIIDLDNKKVIKTISEDDIENIHFSRHDKYATINSGEKYNYKSILFDLKHDEEVDFPDMHGTYIKNITVSPDEKHAKLHCASGERMIYNLQTKRIYYLPPNIKSVDFLSMRSLLFVLFNNGEAGTYDFRNKTFRRVASNVYEFRKFSPGSNIFIIYNDKKIQQDVPSSAVYHTPIRKLASLKTKGAIKNHICARGEKSLIIHQTQSDPGTNIICNTLTGKPIPVNLKRDDMPFFSADGNTLVVFSPETTKLYHLAKPVKPDTNKEWDPGSILQNMYMLTAPKTAKELANILNKHITTLTVELKMLVILELLVKTNKGGLGNEFLYSLHPGLKKSIGGKLSVNKKRAIIRALIERYNLSSPKTIRDLMAIRGKDITIIRTEVNLLLAMQLITRTHRRNAQEPFLYSLHPRLTDFSESQAEKIKEPDGWYFTSRQGPIKNQDTTILHHKNKLLQVTVEKVAESEKADMLVKIVFINSDGKKLTDYINQPSNKTTYDTAQNIRAYLEGIGFDSSHKKDFTHSDILQMFSDTPLPELGKFRGPVDLYKILDVNSTVSTDEIEEAFNALSLTIDPNKEDKENPNDINIAYKVLSNPLKRLDYDLFGYKDIDNPEIYQAMENIMKNRLAEHKEKINNFILNYAIKHKDKVQDLPDMPKINTAFWDSVKNSNGEDAVKRLQNILAETGGKIQVMFVKDRSELPVFEGKKVWGHAGTYITVFALESERDTPLGRKKIIGRLFHEIWARSTRTKDIYIEEIRKSRPKTARKVLKTAKQARTRYNEEISQIYNQITKSRRITSPELQKQFAELRFEKQVDYINRDLTLPDKTADEFVNSEKWNPINILKKMYALTKPRTIAELAEIRKRHKSIVRIEVSMLTELGLFKKEIRNGIKSYRLHPAFSDSTGEQLDIDKKRKIADTILKRYDFSSPRTIWELVKIHCKNQTLIRVEIATLFALQLLTKSDRPHPGDPYRYSLHPELKEPDKEQITTSFSSEKQKLNDWNPTKGKFSLLDIATLPYKNGVLKIMVKKMTTNQNFEVLTKITFTSPKHNINLARYIYQPADKTAYNVAENICAYLRETGFGLSQDNASDLSELLQMFSAPPLPEMGKFDLLPVKLYAILGVKKNATLGEIKKTFDRLSQKDQLAKHTKNAITEKKLEDIKIAYQILSNPSKRLNYNLFGHKGNKGGIINIIKAMRQLTAPATLAELVKIRGKLPCTVQFEIDILRDLKLIKISGTGSHQDPFLYSLHPMLKGLTDEEIDIIYYDIKDEQGRDPMQIYYRSKIDPEILPCLQLEIIQKVQAIIHDWNFRFAPMEPKKQVLWHVFVNELIPQQQQVMGLITKINQACQERGSSEKIKILNTSENLAEVLQDFSQDPNNVIHVMLNDENRLNEVPQGIKTAVFKGELGDYAQVEGIMAVSRVLAIEDTQKRNRALRMLHKLLTGEPFEGELPDTDDPETLAKAIIFNLPEILVLDPAELTILNDNLIFYLKHA